MACPLWVGSGFEPILVNWRNRPQPAVAPRPPKRSFTGNGLPPHPLVGPVASIRDKLIRWRSGALRPSICRSNRCSPLQRSGGVTRGWSDPTLSVAARPPQPVSRSHDRSRPPLYRRGGQPRIAGAIGDAAMTGHWIAHDRAARELLRTWRGREIEKTDGIVAVFDSAADAAAFAVDYHRALAALGMPFKARAGVHVGPITLRENSPADVAVGAKRFEVDGLGVSIAARVMSAAAGGQTLLTAAARSALGESPLRVQSHGYWRLKGVHDPVELFEVGDAQAPFTPPPDEDKAYRVVRVDENVATGAPSAPQPGARTRRLHRPQRRTAKPRAEAGVGLPAADPPGTRRHRQDAHRPPLRDGLAGRLARRRDLLRPERCQHAGRHLLCRGSGPGRAAGQGRSRGATGPCHRRAWALPP